MSEARTSSESRSVILFVLPIGISAKSFIIQKLSIRKIIEKPIKLQPSGIFRYNNTPPPANKMKNKKKFNPMTVRLRRCFRSFDLIRRRLFGSKEFLGRGLIM